MTLLAEHGGCVRGVAASARKSRRRFGGTLEPMSRVRATWAIREGRELHRIESLELDRSFAAMQSEPRNQAACAVLSEIAGAAIREDQSEPVGFRLLGAVLEALEEGLEPWAAVRYYEFWTLRLHGVLADLELCASCGGPLARGGGLAAIPGEGLLCAGCGRRRGEEEVRLGAHDRAALARFLSDPPRAIGDLAPRCLPGDPLARLLRGSIERFLERGVRAYRHLEALS